MPTTREHWGRKTPCSHKRKSWWSGCMEHSQWKSDKFFDPQVRTVFRRTCSPSPIIYLLSKRRLPIRVVHRRYRHHLGIYFDCIGKDMLRLVTCHPQTVLPESNLLYSAVSSSSSQSSQCYIPGTIPCPCPFARALRRTRSHSRLPDGNNALLALDFFGTLRRKHIRSSTASA
jgi:hypothetical protein